MRIILKWFIFTILFILSFNELLSQSDFKEGFIINSKLDTINGYIDCNNNQFYSCKFKKELNGGVEFFKPNEIFGYRIKDDKFYIAKTVTIQKSYIQNKETDFDKPLDPRFITKVWYLDSGKLQENVFLEYLIKGKVNVYYFSDKNSHSHYFANKENDTLIDLTQELVMVYENGVILKQYNSDSYKGKLISLMSECPQIRNEIQKSKIGHRELIKIAKDYHEYSCKDYSCIVYSRNIKSTKFNYSISIGAGVSQTSKIEYQTTSSNVTTPPLFKDNQYFNLGIDLHILNYLPEREKMSFKIGFDYFKNQYSNQSSIKIFSKDTIVNRYYDSHNICLNIRLIQKVFTLKSSPYFGFGLSGLYSFNEKYEDYKSTMNFNVPTKNSFNKFQIGINLSLGYEFHIFNNQKINIEIQHKQFLFDQFNTLILLGYEI